MPWLFVLVVSILTFGQAAISDDEEASQKKAVVDEDRFERCVQSRAIRSANVVNDNLILFEMVGGKTYLNELPGSCRGLSRDGRFTYELSERRLCRGDRIRILMQSGSQMIEGRSCKIGEFRLLTDAEIEQVFGQRVIESEDVPPAEIEEMDEPD